MIRMWNTDRLTLAGKNRSRM